MNMHQLHQKYRNADYTEVENDPDHIRAVKSLQLFNKGDFGMLIVPPATEEFALAIAISTCGKSSDRVGFIKVPKLKSCIFVDTVSSKKKLKTDVQNAESYIGRALPKGFKLATTREVYSKDVCNCDLGSEYEDMLEYVSCFVENKCDNFEGIFVMLDSVIFSPNNFEKSKFDKFLAWASEIKKQGKTLVVISQYQIPQIRYLADHMNFVINCVPDQRGTYDGSCVFSVQWLSLAINEDTGINSISARRLTENQSNVIQFQFQDQDRNKNPYFTVQGYSGSDRKRSWYQFVSLTFFNSL